MSAWQRGCKWWLWKLATVAALLMPAPGHAQEKVFGDIAIRYEPHQFFNNWDHGYDALEFVVSNRSATEPHRVMFKLPPGFAPGADLRHISREIDVKPQSTVRVGLWRPKLSMTNQQCVAFLDGKDLRVTEWQAQANFNYFPNSTHNISVLIPQALGPWPGGIIQNKVMGLGRLYKINEITSPDGRTVTNFGNTYNYQWQWPSPRDFRWHEQWLSYSAYDGVVIPGQTLEALPEAAKSALWRYVECGGSLLIWGAWQVPEHWKQRGKGTIGSLSIYPVGFGECLVTTEDKDADFQRWPPQQWHRLAESWENTARPFPELTAAAAHVLFPVVDNVDVPVRGLFLVILGYVAVIGPLNLYVLSRKRRRIWLLLTVPLIALATSSAVFGYMVWTEPGGTHVRTESLTVLDETTARAATISWLGIYATVSPRDGLHFSPETELTPLWRSRGFGQSGGGGAARTIDWSTDQHLSPGWVPPRVPVH